MTKNELSTQNLHSLADVIEQVHVALSAQAAKVVNVILSVRNWLIGHCIAQYDFNGKDRAGYDENFLRIWPTN